MRNRFQLFTAVVGLVFFAALQASAVPTVPGATHLLFGTTFAVNPVLGGVVQNDTLIPFEVTDPAGDLILKGFVQDRVVESTTTGEMIFAPRIRDLASPAGRGFITGLRLEGYRGFTTDIDYRTDGLGDLGPDQVSRNLILGEALTFEYFGLLAPPDSGYFISVLTNSKVFAPRGRITIFVLDEFTGEEYRVVLEHTMAPAYDSDGDGAANGFDNCPDEPNPDQEDSNFDGVGDACQCGDPNESGEYESDDLEFAYKCLSNADDPVCIDALSHGDANGTGDWESDDLLGIFNAMQTQYSGAEPTGPRLICAAARPQ